MLSPNVEISGVRTSVRVTAVHRRGEEPEIQNNPGRNARGVLYWWPKSSAGGADALAKLCQIAVRARHVKGAYRILRVLLAQPLACKLLILRNGEMSEWLKEHAWKTIRATLTKSHRNTSQRIRIKDLQL